MEDIGAEVSQKMRSAIKAKLMELDCYVDDELPDYIMVMVANKRTKSQMNEDLQLFLTTKTSVFVDWLHIVLKKLKEVHVSNPDVYSKTLKRKGEEISTNAKVKKEKKEKKVFKKLKEAVTPQKSLTDDLPITANKLSEVRKIIIMQENENSLNNVINDDSFDIPLLSEVNLSNESELEMLEKRIKNVKTRLGIQVESESEDEDFINIKAEPDELFPNEKTQDKNQRKITVETENKETESKNSNNDKSFKHARITFESGVVSKKLSVLERLGKRNAVNTEEVIKENNLQSEEKNFDFKQNATSPINRILSKRYKPNNTTKTDKNKNDRKRILQFEKPRESVLSRLGIMSKVAIPDKPKEPVMHEEIAEKEEPIIKEVQSVIKIKSRIILPTSKQANKNLLLKAVADAQRSIAQTPNVGNNIDKPTSLYTKKFQEKTETTVKPAKRKLLDAEKAKLKNIIVHIARDELKSEDNQEYIPQPVRKTVVNENVVYVPTAKSPKSPVDAPQPVMSHKFIVTLDGVDKTKFLKKDEEQTPTKRAPSPIIFEQPKSDNTKNKSNIPDELPAVSALKNKERCKYWPLCKHGEKCDFIHPTISCKMFPSCKFGDKCVYIHPTCKFETSCTRRDCPYSHTAANKAVASRIIPPVTTIHVAKQTLQTCKYFPNCSNVHCTFYHPKPCKFGKYCKNQSECNFSHTYIPKTSNLTWRSNKV